MAHAHSAVPPGNVVGSIPTPGVFHKVKDVHQYEPMRREAKELAPDHEDFEFFQIDSEYKTTRDGRLEVFMYGETMAGNSVVVISSGFNPYFVIKSPEDWSSWDYGRFESVLEETLRHQVGEKGEAGQFPKLVLDITPFKAFDLYGYHGESPEDFLKIHLAYPTLVRKCRLLLEYPMGRKKSNFLPEITEWWPGDLPCPTKNPFKDKDKHRGYPLFFKIYEANVDFMLRFQVDHKIRATGWVKLSKGRYGRVDTHNTISTCQIEIRCDHEAVGYSEKTTKQVPQMGVYSYDAEVLIGPEFKFPEAIYHKKTPDGKMMRDRWGKPIPIPGSGEKMIQMGYLKIQGDKTKRGIHMVSDSDEIPGADQVYCYRDERSFLKGFSNDVITSDPTFLVDFNGNTFDKPYFIDRLKQNGCWATHSVLGRIKGQRSDYNAHKTETKVTSIPGRVQIDVHQYLKREKKYRSYSLNATSSRILGESKVDIDIRKINDMQEHGPDERSKLAYYCIMDSVLPWKMISELKIIVNCIQMAYVAGVSIQQLMDRGQQIRMLAQIYHYAKDTVSDPIPNGGKAKLQYPYVVPVHPTFLRFITEKFQGAVVIDVHSGYHDEPLNTLDFNSLYPSIIIAHNLCYTTFVNEETISRFHLVEDVHYKRVPSLGERPDGSVFEDKEPTNPCFLLIPQYAYASVVKRAGLILGEDYVTMDFAGVPKKMDHIFATDSVVEKLRVAGLEGGEKHYVVEDSEILGRSVIRLVAVKKGVMPLLLEGLLSKRKEVRREGEHETDKGILAIIDALQLAYKTMANSMYGATGTGEKGYLPLREIAETVTRYGRYYIVMTKWLVETRFCRKNGYPFDAKCIYGDTDSVFIRLDNVQTPMLRPKDSPWVYELVDPKNPSKRRTLTSPYDFEMVRDYGIEMAKYVTDHIGMYPMCLAFEKSFNGILLVSKKRYAGDKLVWAENRSGVYELQFGATKFSATGLECVRRDSCQLVGEMVETVLKKVIMDRDVGGAVEYVYQEIEKLLTGKTRYSKLIITRSLSRKPKDYKSKAAHVTLAQKVASRDPGNAHRIGDRVKYIIVKGKKNQKTHELAEDPLYAFDNGIQPDYEWYLHNQIQKPLDRIFYFVKKNGKALDEMLDKNPEIRDRFNKNFKAKTEEDVIDEDEILEDQEQDMEEALQWEQGDDIYGDMEEDTFVPSRDSPIEISYERKSPSDDMDVDTNGRDREDSPTEISHESELTSNDMDVDTNVNDREDSKRKIEDTKKDFMSKFTRVGVNERMPSIVRNTKKKNVNNTAIQSTLSRGGLVTGTIPIKRAQGDDTLENKKKATQREKDRIKKEQQDGMNRGVAHDIMFTGRHMRNVVKKYAIIEKPNEWLAEPTAVRGAKGVTKFFDVVPTCQICGCAVKNPRSAICEGCKPSHDECFAEGRPPCKECKDKRSRIDETLRESMQRLHLVETEVHKSLDICHQCVKKNPSMGLLSCSNTDCDNLYDRKTAWRDVAREHRLKELNW